MICENCELLKKEIDRLRDKNDIWDKIWLTKVERLEQERNELRAENKNLSEAHEAAQHYKQERDELREKLADAEFIAHARTDVPELARRLKKSCEVFRKISQTLRQGIPISYEVMNDLADELESPLGEPEPHEWTKVLREDAE